MKESYLCFVEFVAERKDPRRSMTDKRCIMDDQYSHLSHMNKLVFLEEFLDISTHLLAGNTKYTFNNSCILIQSKLIRPTEF